jgi:hypothetical protein
MGSVSTRESWRLRSRVPRAFHSRFDSFERWGKKQKQKTGERACGGCAGGSLGVRGGETVVIG